LRDPVAGLDKQRFDVATRPAAQQYLYLASEVRINDTLKRLDAVREC
jgi:hypothetical protein